MRGGGLLFVGAAPRTHHEEAAEPQLDELGEAFEAVRRRPGDGEGVDDLVGQGLRLRRVVREVGVHVVGVVDRLERAALAVGHRPGDRAVHHGEPGIRADATADHAAGHGAVVVHEHRHVGAEPEALDVETSAGARRQSGLDSPPQAIGIDSDGERHGVGEAAGDLDHPRPRRGDVDGHLRLLVAEPAQPADRRTAAHPERRRRAQSARGVGVEVERHLVAPQVALQSLQVVLELGDRRRRQTEVGERRVTAADAEHQPPAGLGLDAGRRRGRRRRVPGDRVGDGGRQLQRRRRRGRHRQGDVRVPRQALRVDDADPGPPFALQAPGPRRSGPRQPDARRPHLDARHPAHPRNRAPVRRDRPDPADREGRDVTSGTSRDPSGCRSGRPAAAPCAARCRASRPPAVSRRRRACRPGRRRRPCR